MSRTWFKSESTLYSCLNVKELLVRNRLEIWSLSNGNGTRTHNHLVCKSTVAVTYVCFLDKKWKFTSKIRTCIISFKFIPYPSLKPYGRIVRNICYPIPLSSDLNWFSFKIQSICICTSCSFKFFNNTDSIWRSFALTFAKMNI